MYSVYGHHVTVGGGRGGFRPQSRSVGGMSRVRKDERLQISNGNEKVQFCVTLYLRPA